MKLKEKLAEELLDEDTDSLMSAFLKGFEKALELVDNRLFERCIQGVGDLDEIGEEEVCD